MKKVISILLVAALALCLAACTKNENKIDVEPNEGEIKISGEITSMSGNILTLSTNDKNVSSDKCTFSFSDEIAIVEDGVYVTDYTADALYGKKVSVICNELIQETYPAGLTKVRVIIIEE